MKRTQYTAAILATAVSSAILGYAGPAYSAESESDLLNDKFTVSLGTFLVDTKTKVSVDGNAGQQGTPIDLSKDLGFKDANRWRLDASWHFAENHKLRVMYFNTDQTRTATLDRDITVGDTTYPISAEVTSKNSTQVAELAYEYIFLKRENYEISGTFGIHSVKFEFSLSGEGSVDGGETVSGRTEAAVAKAPLPVIGVRGMWEFAPQWYLDGQLQYFKLSMEGFDGSITDSRIAVTRMFGAHWGVGAGFNNFTTRVGVDKDKFNGDLKWRYSGGQLFVTGSF